MNQKRYLYKVSTVGLGEYYVISTDMTTAGKALEDYLNRHQYGYSSNRTVHAVTIITEVIDVEKTPKETTKLLITS